MQGSFYLFSFSKINSECHNAQPVRFLISQRRNPKEALYKPPHPAAERGEMRSVYGTILEILAQLPRCGTAALANKPASSSALQKLQRLSSLLSEN